MKVDDKRTTLTIDALTTSWINHAIHANPEYQRGSTWGRRQQQLLIDSVLRGYPLPRFYFQQKASTDPLSSSVEHSFSGSARLCCAVLVHDPIRSRYNRRVIDEASSP